MYKSIKKNGRKIRMEKSTLVLLILQSRDWCILGIMRRRLEIFDFSYYIFSTPLPVRKNPNYS